MFFSVQKQKHISREDVPCAILMFDSWDDFGFETQHHLIVIDENRRKHRIGAVKIGQFNMTTARVSIPKSFDVLDSQFFSLGQDENYYASLYALPAKLRRLVTSGLRDLVAHQGSLDSAMTEPVTTISLMRGISLKTIRGQFTRVLNGGKRLSAYDFTYRPSAESRFELRFKVEPDSMPPTNIHVLVGRNGVGKTRMLNRMALALVHTKVLADFGVFEETEPVTVGAQLFASVVAVSFSAFDEFQAISNPDEALIPYHHIGLHRADGDANVAGPKSPIELATEFANSAVNCQQNVRVQRWRAALKSLEADPGFRGAKIADLAKESSNSQNSLARAKHLYAPLSSGHKLVLLTITRLVETMEEQTLVLLDEPEAHLHPPLLSAFIRALSDLLVNRNGVAIVATHSPVVVQEVPKRCTWKITRSGNEVNVTRPEIETFGENVSVLTRELFGLEVTESGFHALLQRSVNRNATFDEVSKEFSGQLGGEARALARALIALREQES